MNEHLEDAYRSTQGGGFYISGDIHSTDATRSVVKCLNDGVFLVVATITPPVGVSALATTEYRRTSHERKIICRVADESGTILTGRVQPVENVLRLDQDHATDHALAGASCKGIDGFTTQFTTANEIQVWFVVEMRLSEVLVLFCDARPDTNFTTEIFRMAKTFQTIGVPQI